MLAVLGAGAVDCSGPDGVARLGAWSPLGGSPTPRNFASGADATVLFAGYIRDVPPGCQGEADYVLGRFRDADLRWLQSANGVFAFVIVDRRQPRCLLGVDRLGVRPLLVSADESGVRFANDLGVVAAARRPPREIDHDTLQELIAVGFPLSERTVLRGIERVPPGSLVEVTPRGRQVHRYWSVAELPVPRAHEIEPFLDESRERLRAAIVRLAARSAEPPLCLLSTGYDSRRILLEGHAAGVPFETMTAVWPFRGLAKTSIDPPVIAELCGRLGVGNRLIRLPGSGEAHLLRGDRVARDMLLDYQVRGVDHIWAIPLLAEIPPSAGRLNFDGFLGDTFFNNPFYALPRRLWGQWRIDEAMTAAIAPLHEHWDRIWDGLASSPLADRIRDALRALPEGPGRLSLLYLLGRSRRVPAILPYGLIDLRIESVCPYLDHEVMDHALALDPLLKAEHRLQRAALDRHFPAFADLPSSHSDAAEIPPRFRVAIDVADPESIRPFTAGSLRVLLRSALGRRSAPRATPSDVAFAMLSWMGVRRRGGEWREARLRDLGHTLNTIGWLGHADARELRRGREASLDWMARRSLRHDSVPDAPGNDAT
jgi:glutamine amidotransferase-like protein